MAAYISRCRQPQRVNVTGDLYHGQVPEGAIYVGRQAPGLKRSPYHNPFPVAEYGLDEALRLYRIHLDEHPELAERARRELRGHDLACWCKLADRCHADVLLEVANGAAYA